MTNAMDELTFTKNRDASNETFLPHYMMVQAAENALIEKALRRTVGIPEMPGEPAWDILLYLFTQTSNKDGTLTKSAWLAAGVPQTTGLRYLASLETLGMIERSTGRDSRCTILRLTPAGRQRMMHYFEELHAFRKSADRKAIRGQPFRKVG
jgi:hypothetical protein